MKTLGEEKPNINPGHSQVGAGPQQSRVAAGCDTDLTSPDLHRADLSALRLPLGRLQQLSSSHAAPRSWSESKTALSQEEKGLALG